MTALPDVVPLAPLPPDFGRILLGEFPSEFFRLANSTAREPESFLGAQSQPPQSGEGIAQMGFELAPDFGSEVRLSAQFLLPGLEGEF